MNVFDIRIPPLRERRDDIRLLASSFLSEFERGPGGRRTELQPDALDALLRHEWPGNVRELRNVLERATIICENGRIRPEDLSLRAAETAVVDSTDLEVIERRAIERVMREVEGNKTRASRQLGITRTQLYMRLRKHGLEPARA